MTVDLRVVFALEALLKRAREGTISGITFTTLERHDVVIQGWAGDFQGQKIVTLEPRHLYDRETG